MEISTCKDFTKIEPGMRLQVMENGALVDNGYVVGVSLPEKDRIGTIVIRTAAFGAKPFMFGFVDERCEKFPCWRYYRHRGDKNRLIWESDDKDPIYGFNFDIDVLEL